MSETKKKPSTKPVKTIRQGAVGASIWKRQSPSGFEYFDFTLSRSWKTQKSGKEGYSPNFFASNESELYAVIAEARNWIENQQASMMVEDVNTDVMVKVTEAANGKVNPDSAYMSF